MDRVCANQVIRRAATRSRDDTMVVQENQPISQKSTVRGVDAERHLFISKFASRSQGENASLVPVDFFNREFMLVDGVEVCLLRGGRLLGGITERFA